MKTTRPTLTSVEIDHSTATARPSHGRCRNAAVRTPPPDRHLPRVLGSVGVAVALFISGLGLAASPAFASTMVAFVPTGAPQTWTVPPGVTTATFDVFGAQGGGFDGGGFNNGPVHGGLGGEALATIAVTPGEVLQVNVGGHGGFVTEGG